MAQNKTIYTDADVFEFIENTVDSEQKRSDSLRLLEIFSEMIGVQPRMWGPSIIGFGTYHYKYESGHEGDAPILGFSPRKSAISLYVYSDTEKSNDALKRLGKYKMGKACIYVKKLADIDEEVLKEITKENIDFVKERYATSSPKS